MNDISRVRKLVPEILEAASKTSVNARDLVLRRSRRWDLSRRDSALLMRVCLGTIRARGTLEQVLICFSGLPLKRIHRDIRPVLLAALYEMIYLEKVPVHAAVNEAVEAAKIRGGRKAGGFANAVLRKVLGGLTRLDRAELKALGPQPDSRVLEGDGGRFALFDRSVFIPWKENPVRHLAQTRSHPEWLVRRWLPRFGSRGVVRMLRSHNRIPEHGLRENPLRPPEGGLLAYLRSHGIDACPGPFPGCVRVKDVGRALALEGFSRGCYSVQDETAQAAVQVAGIRPGDAILDACAAPGGKTGVAVPLAGDKGRVVAMDLSFDRLGAMAQGLNRQGFSVPLLVSDGRRPPFPPLSFDVVILDVPCSNTGVLGRRVEVRWRLTPGKLASLARAQAALLKACAPLARRTVLYSTCSIEPEENQDLIRAFAETHPCWRVEAERIALPGRHDGGYAARLVRAEG